MRRLDGFAAILAATAVAGIAGYIVTIVVHNSTSAATYAIFAVFWAGLYLVVGGLSGIQQEVTRGTLRRSEPDAPGANRARNFGVVFASFVFLAVVSSAWIWVQPVFPTGGWALVWPLATAAASYVLVAVLSGTLYGLTQWRALAVLIAIDGLLRLALLLAVLIVTRDVVVLAWVAALPFPLALLLVWPAIRSKIAGASRLDSNYRTLTWNVLRVVLAAVATSVLVSGFPLLLSITSADAPTALVAELIFTITLARAPLVVVVMALQSYFVVRFRDSPTWRIEFLRLQGVIVALGILLAIVAYFFGTWAFEVVSSKAVTLDGIFLALLVVSSALVGAMTVATSAALARGNHLVFSASWVVAAIVTIVALLIPGDVVTRVAVALLIGPAAGLVVNLAWLAWHRDEASKLA